MKRENVNQEKRERIKSPPENSSQRIDFFMHRQVFLLKRRLLSDAKTPKLTCSKMLITTSLGFRKFGNEPDAPQAFANVGYVDQDILEKQGVLSHRQLTT